MRSIRWCGCARLVLALPLFLAGAWAQDLLTETTCSDVRTELGAREAKSPLEFGVRVIRPQLDFAFRFLAGFSIDVPFRQFLGKGNSIRVAARVQPRDGSKPPVCFVQTKDLPEVPEGAKTEFELAGGFYLGEGNYHIEFAVSDQKGRLSRKGLNITAARRRGQGKLPLSLRPGSIQTIPRLGWTSRPYPPGRAPRQVTLLFHVTSLYGPRTLLRLYDVGLLLSSLLTVLSKGDFDEVRLIAFNLDQQRELFRRERFSAQDVPKLVEVLLSVNLPVVSLAVLEKERQHLGLVDSLVREELSAEPRSAAIVFLGPYARDESGWKSLPCEPDHAGTPLFYLEHRVDVVWARCGGWQFAQSPGGWPPADSVCPTLSNEMSLPVRPPEYADTLEKLVRGCSGNVYRIHSPAELAAAIDKMNSKMAQAH